MKLPSVTARAAISSSCVSHACTFVPIVRPRLSLASEAFAAAVPPFAILTGVVNSVSILPPLISTYFINISLSNSLS